MPITWKNVNGPETVGAARLLVGAGNSIERAGDNLKDIFKAYQQNETRQYDGEVEANSQAFKDQIANYGTSEELAAAQAAGELDASRFGRRIDRDLVRNGPQAQIDKLRGRETVDTERELAPVMDQLAQARANNDDAGHAAIVEEYNDLLSRGNKLGITAERFQAQNRKELEQRFLDEDRDRENELRTDTDSFNSIRDIEVANGGTIEQIRKRVIEGTQNLSGTVQMDNLKSIEDAVKAYYGTTSEQESEVQNTAAGYQRAAERKITEAQTALQHLKEDKPVNSNFSFTDENRLGIDGAIEEIKKSNAGWDKNTLASGITSAVDTLEKSFKGASKDPNIGSIVLRAVRMVGDPYEAFGIFGNNDLGDVSKFSTILQQQYKEYRISEENKDAVRDAEFNFAELKAKQAALVAQQTGDLRNTIKKRNRGASLLSQ